MRRETAFMLRRDGAEIPVDVHPYGVTKVQSNTRECNLLAAVFLANHSQVNKIEAIRFINSFLAEIVIQANEDDVDILDTPETIRKYLLREISRFPKTFIQVLEWKRIVGDPKAIAKELVQWYNPMVFSTFDEAFNVDTQDKGIALAYALNQEFIRIRIGGRYDFEDDRTYHARIGSVGFNWDPLIRQSVHNHLKKKEIDWIEIIRDNESDTGDPLGTSDLAVYRSLSGRALSDISVIDFLLEKTPMENPLWFNPNSLDAVIYEFLKRECRLSELKQLYKNEQSIFNRIQELCLFERIRLIEMKD